MSREIHKILKQFWGFDQFRPLQEEIIRSVISGKDTLALLPTGGGKSICFQVPAIAQEGICIVISPLIALMRDQVDNLKSRGIKADAIHSGLSKREIDILLDNCVYGNIKFLYVSPERLKTEIFIARVKKMNVNLIAIDEAHCISQWGYDFRPSYLEISKLKDILPKVPFLALTATATPKVVLDIQDKLLFKKPNAFQKSFERTNLHYIVAKEEDKLGKMLKVIQKVNGTGIIYVRNRKKTKEIANYLQNRNISADYYHAGLASELRTKKQADWIQNKTRIIVSTNAFGMGIDKPDVRFVINLDLPDSLEAYFQEAGRGGRDENKSYAVLLVNESDRENLINAVENKFPSKDIIKKVYFAIGNHYRIAIGTGEGSTYPLNLNLLKSETGISTVDVYNSVLFLEQAGYFEVSEAFHNPSRIKIEVTNEQLYDFQIRNKVYASYIKLLLRSYGGMFDSFQKIKEIDLAKRTGQPVTKIINLLEKLQDLEILSYEKASDLPMITYLTPRIDIKQIRIGKEIYDERKKDALSKAEHVINYAFSDTTCRSQILLSYFGEKDASVCGHCDVCINKKKKTSISYAELESAQHFILSKLDSLPKEISEIIHLAGSNFSEESIKTGIQWLLDNNKIRLNDANQLTLKR